MKYLIRIYIFVQVFRSLVENTKNINGAKVENHRFCASVHYRNVDEKVTTLFRFPSVTLNMQRKYKKLVHKICLTI